MSMIPGAIIPAATINIHYEQGQNLVIKQTESGEVTIDLQNGEQVIQKIYQQNIFYRNPTYSDLHRQPLASYSPRDRKGILEKIRKALSLSGHLNPTVHIEIETAQLCLSSHTQNSSLPPTIANIIFYEAKYKLV